MNIKIKPLLYIFIIVLIVFTIIGVLFNNNVIAAKQNKVFEQLEHSVVNAPKDIDTDNKTIYFKVNDENHLAAAVRELNEAIKETEYAQYNLEVRSEFENDSLYDAWQGVQYDVYEIMGQKKYTELPKLALQFSKQYPQYTSNFSMNEHYVFVTLSDGENHLYRMLPVNSTDMRMWG